MIRVLIIGGYGNFGGTIARRLAGHQNIQLLIGGRSLQKATEFCSGLNTANTALPVALDIQSDITPALKHHHPDLVIHTSGPFQGQGYDVAKACIACGVHYCDLADGRDFVVRIGQLDGAARAAGVAVIVGASSVPSLTTAVMDYLSGQGFCVEEIDYGIATAQQTRLGQATTAATLSYAGQAISLLEKDGMTKVYGWQDIHVEDYPELGLRLMSNVDVPDLDLFPERYPSLKRQRFYAGVEVKLLQIGIWLMSWPVRWGLIKSLSAYAGVLARMAGLFDFLGTNRSGFHFHAMGKDKTGAAFRKSFYLIAKSGDGPNIPCIPCIWIAENMADGYKFPVGAYPCVGMLDLDTYIKMLKGLDIRSFWRE